MAIASMTGFGAGQASDGAERISVELKSVNGKFCEVKARLPRELASLESEVQRLVKERLSRGNVEVFVRREAAEQGAHVPEVNEAALNALAKTLAKAAENAGIPGGVTLRDLLVVPGIVSLAERPPDVEAAARALQKALAQGLDQLVEARKREGAALETDLRVRVAILRRHANEVARLVPESVSTYRERLKTRISELLSGGEVDPGRIEQEVVLFADRTDVTEELTRLNTHLTEFERLLGKSGPVGRQFDFLLQEINREVNTTGSKSQAGEIAHLVVELKTELERLREQVQNVE